MNGFAAILLTSYLIPLLLSIAMYVLSALALYTMAKRRGIRKAWLSWIPIGDAWILGSLSDQYRYVTRRQEKKKRKILLTLYLVLAALMAVFLGALIAIVTQGAMLEADMATDSTYGTIGAMTTAMMLLTLPMMGVSIAALVVRYMALYDVYSSAAPENAVLFLVLSIFITVTEAFFLFFNRNSDRGMVPRQRELPDGGGVKVYGLPQKEERDPWDQN